MASSPKVIVFGPTGAVGSAAATTAHALGATVTLAMRDPSKPIPGIPSDQLSAYTKAQADLTDPASVGAAVRQSGAKHAFIYLAHFSQDHMRGTIQALKDAGVGLVVFLSSFTVAGELEAIKQDDIIDYLHAQAELNLRSIFGETGYVALRPGAFASNELQYAQGFAAGHVKIASPHARIDCIVPADIGRVGGTILANGAPEDGNRALYLYGPEFIMPRESVATIARVLGKDPKVTECNKEEARTELVEGRGYPPPLAEYFLKTTFGPQPEGELVLFGHAVRGEDRGNVEKYGGGKRATTLEEYVRENRAKFESGEKFTV